MVAPIREYQQQTNTPTYDFSGRAATADDFGYGNAIAELGGTIQRTADVWKRQKEQDEMADAQMRVAESQNMFADRMATLQKEAKPGSYTAGTIRNEMNEYYNTIANTYKTDSARKYISVNGSHLAGKAFQQSVAFDVDLKAKDQFSKQGELLDMAGKRILSGMSSYEEERAKAMAEMQSGVGVYDTSYLDAKGRLVAQEHYKKQIEGLASIAAENAILNPQFRATTLATMKSAVEKALPASAVKFAQTYDKLKPEQKQIESTIRTTAQTYGVDPDFMVALALRESSLNPAAKNPKSSAGGVFQFIDATWNSVAPGQDKMDANANIEAGIKMFAANLKKFNGNYDLALAAHHVGEGKAKQALQDASVGDVDTSTRDWLAGIKAAKAKMSGETVAITEVPKEVQSQMPSFFNDLSPEKQLRFIQKMQHVDKEQRNLAMEQVKKTVQDHTNFALENGKPPPQQLPAAAFGGNVALMAEYQYTMKAAEAVQGMANASPADQKALIDSMKVYRPDMPAGFYDNQVRIADKAEQIFKKSNEAWKTDPVSKIRQMSMDMSQDKQVPAPLKPLDFTVLQDGAGNAKPIGDQLAERTSFVNVAEAKTGKRAFVDNQEAKQLRDVIINMRPDLATKFVESLTNGMNRQDAAGLMIQIAPDNKALAASVGALKASWADPVTRQKDANFMLRGFEILHGFPKEKGEEKLPKTFIMPSNEEYRKSVAAYVQGLEVSPQQFDAIMDAATAHYVGKQTKESKYDLGLKVPGNASAFVDSIKAVFPKASLGGTDMFIPYGMDKQKFIENAKNEVSVLTNGTVGKNDFTLRFDAATEKYEVYVGRTAKTYPDGRKMLIDPTNPSLAPVFDTGAQQQAPAKFLGGNVPMPEDEYIKSMKTQGISGIMNSIIPKGK